MIRIAHTGDWHIGPSGPELDPETGLNARMLDRSRTAEVALDEMCRACDLIIHTGDVWHSPKPSPTEVRKAKTAFSSLLDYSCWGLLLLGNHDSPKNPSEVNALSYLDDEAFLQIVDRPMVVNVLRYIYAPDRYCLAGLNDALDGAEPVLQVACMPYPYMAALLREPVVQTLDPVERARLMRTKVMDVLRGMRAEKLPSIPMILAAHLSIDTAITGAGDRMMMLGGEWTLDSRELDAIGFDAVLLGHIHKHQEIPDVPTPMAYSGSLEPVTFAEEGEPKGWICWTLDPGPIDHSCPTWEFVPVENRGMVTYDEVAGTTTATTNLEGIWNPALKLSHQDTIVRVRIPGTMAPQVTKIKRRLLELGAFSVQVEVVPVEHVRRREVTVEHGMDLGEAMAAWMEQVPAAKEQGENLVSIAKEIVASVEGAAT